MICLNDDVLLKNTLKRCLNQNDDVDVDVGLPLLIKAGNCQGPLWEVRDACLVLGLSVDAFAAGEAGAATGMGPSPAIQAGTGTQHKSIQYMCMFTCICIYIYI